MSHSKPEDDDEVDFMSDEFLQQCTKNDVRPGLLFKSSEKRVHEQLKRKEDDRQKKLGHKNREEQNRSSGLDTAIGADNKGFKMLEKMGFKAGQSLGKRTGSCGEFLEPIPVKIKRDRGCLGQKTVIEERKKKKEELGDVSSFRERLQASSVAGANRLDLERGRRICQTLDTNTGVEPLERWYWPPQPKPKSNEDSEAEFHESEEDEEEDIVDPEDQLAIIVDYLRTKYFYCIWCGAQFDNDEDLAKSCPGLTRDDH